MDFHQSTIVLEKINSLHKSLQAGGGQVAPIERDLMLSYIRQLYETVLNPMGASAPAPAAPAPKPEEPPAPVAPQRKPAPPKIIEIPDTLKDLAPPTPQPVRQAPPAPAPKVVEVAPPPPAPRAPEPAPQPAKTEKISAKVEALFSFQQARELSDKLGDRPITDLTKAMAINDRLQYMNELFGKDADSMTETLKLLNKFENLDQARSLLMSVAEQYHWADEEKIDTAKDFIKLIRRRYSY